MPGFLASVLYLKIKVQDPTKIHLQLLQCIKMPGLLLCVCGRGLQMKKLKKVKVSVLSSIKKIIDQTIVIKCLLILVAKQVYLSLNN